MPLRVIGVGATLTPPAQLSLCSRFAALLIKGRDGVCRAAETRFIASPRDRARGPLKADRIPPKLGQLGPRGTAQWVRRELRHRPSAYVAYTSSQAPHLLPPHERLAMTLKWTR